MDTQILFTIVAGLLLAVAAIGTVYPVLPGSAPAIITLIAWAWIMGSTAAWTAGLVGALLAGAGWSAGMVLTGRKLKQHQIPKRSIAVAMVAAVAGMFLIPVVGLFVGFGGGLPASEYVRRRDFRSALKSSVATLKATGIGVLVEFGMVCLAGASLLDPEREPPPEPQPCQAAEEAADEAHPGEGAHVEQDDRQVAADDAADHESDGARQLPRGRPFLELARVLQASLLRLSGRGIGTKMDLARVGADGERVAGIASTSEYHCDAVGATPLAPSVLGDALASLSAAPPSSI